jgi:hypothetical protein
MAQNSQNTAGNIPTSAVGSIGMLKTPCEKSPARTPFYPQSVFSHRDKVLCRVRVRSDIVLRAGVTARAPFGAKEPESRLILHTRRR